MRMTRSEMAAGIVTAAVVATGLAILRAMAAG